MSVISQIIFTLFILNTALLLVTSVLWKHKDVSFSESMMAGSRMYRDLPRYIKRERVKTYLAISYSAIILFMLSLLSFVLFR